MEKQAWYVSVVGKAWFLLGWTWVEETRITTAPSGARPFRMDPGDWQDDV